MVRPLSFVMHSEGTKDARASSAKMAPAMAVRQRAQRDAERGGEQVKKGFQMLRGYQAGGLHAGTILQQCLAAQ